MSQTNPEGRARLTRRLVMDLVCIVIFVTEYSTLLRARFAENRRTIVLMISGWKRQDLSSPCVGRSQEGLLILQGCKADRRTGYGLQSKRST